MRMCPSEETHDREHVEASGRSVFEQDQNGQGFENMAIKKYKRSAADHVMNDPKIIRHPKILFLTACYMRDCLVD